MKGLVVSLHMLLAVAMAASAQQAPEDRSLDVAYLKWTAEEARRIGASTRVNGRVGGILDLRIVHTERSFNYKLRATLLTPDVIRATARLAQLESGLTIDDTMALVSQASNVGGVAVLVEIDPREGSGVIPVDWTAFLGPEGSAPGDPGVLRGVRDLGLGRMRALAGVFRKDYNYERFWITFPTVSAAGTRELIVRIHDKEGRVRWASR